MAKRLTDVEGVDTTWKTVETNDHVHVVLGDGILGDGLQVSLLVTVVESGAWNADPGGVGGGNTQGVDANAGKLIDGGGVQERSVASLEDWAALSAELLTEGPLIGSARSHCIPPNWVVGVLYPRLAIAA